MLYKYRGNSENTNKIFKDKQVWLSNAKGLNDPFECSIQEIAKDWMDKQIKSEMEAHLSGFISGAFLKEKSGGYFYGLPSTQIKKALKTIGKKPTLERKYKYFKEFVKEQTGHYPSSIKKTFDNVDKQLNAVGIFSMTESCTNQLMWAHYAEESKGIAIGFSVDEGSKLADKEYTIPVNYSDVLPEFQGEGLIIESSLYLDELGRGCMKKKVAMSDPTLRLAVSTKPKCWEYEKEWRYIEEEAGLYDLPSKISEVVFGLRCPKEERKKYIKLVESTVPNEVKFFEIRTIKNSNRIEKVKFQL